MHGLGELFPLPQTAPQPPCSASLPSSCGLPQTGPPLSLTASIPRLPRLQIWSRGLPPGEVLGDGTHSGPPESPCTTLASSLLPRLLARNRLTGPVCPSVSQGQTSKCEHSVCGDSRRTCEFTGPASRLPSARVRGGAAAGHEGQRIKGSRKGVCGGRGPPCCTRPPFGARWAVYGSSVLLTTSSQPLHLPGSALMAPLPSRTAASPGLCSEPCQKLPMTKWPTLPQTHKTNSARSREDLGWRPRGPGGSRTSTRCRGGASLRTLGVTAGRSTDRPAP